MTDRELNIDNIFSEIIYIIEQNGAYKQPNSKAFKKMKEEIRAILRQYKPTPVGKYTSSK
jgi:hypothetical protein